MLLNCQIAKQDIMLGTYSHGGPCLIKVVKQTLSKEVHSARCGIQYTRQHGDSAGLARSIMAQEHEYLISKHLHIDSIHSLCPLSKLLLQTLNLK